MASNPYATPTAPVQDRDIGSQSADFIAGGRVVPAGHGWRWLVAGTQLVRAHPGAWIAASLAFIVLAVVLQLIPFIGALAFMVLMPVFIAGFVLGCEAVDAGAPLAFNHLFAGFGHPRRAALLGLGALQVLATAVMVGAMFAIVGFNFGQFGARTLLGILVYATLATVYLMAMWFAVPLVVLANRGVSAALTESLRSTTRNWLPFTVYSAIIALICLALMLVVGAVWGGGFVLGRVGMLVVLVPIVAVFVVLGFAIAMASLYASYRDIFHRR